jgi:hypothetical protein
MPFVQHFKNTNKRYWEQRDMRVQSKKTALQKKILAGAKIQKLQDPFQNTKPHGWWYDVINCSDSANIYCKPKKQWIWPY